MHQRLWLNMKRYSILKKKKKVKYSSTMRIAKKDWNTKKTYENCLEKTNKNKRNTWRNAEKISSKVKFELLILHYHILKIKLKSYLKHFFLTMNIRWGKNTSNLWMWKCKKWQFHSYKNSISILFECLIEGGSWKILQNAINVTGWNKQVDGVENYWKFNSPGGMEEILFNSLK